MKLQPPSLKDRQSVLSQWLRDGAEMHRQGQLDAAKAYYQAILKAQPAHIEAKQLLGFLELQREQFDEAARLLKQVVKANPASANAHIYFANALAKLGRFSEALSNYDIAIMLNPSIAELHTNRATVLIELGRLDDAVLSCDAALRLKPAHVDAHYTRGNALKALEKREDAIASYNAALAISPNFAEAFNNRATAEAGLKLFEAAVLSCDAAISLKPDYAEAHNNRGFALNGLYRPEEALTSLDRALALRPNYPEAWNNRGLALKQLNRLEEELACYDRAIALRPTFVDPHNNRGIVLNALARPSEALAGLDSWLKSAPNDVESRFSRSLIRLQSGDLAGGWRDYDLRFDQKVPLTRRFTHLPSWRGEPLTGKRIIVYEEQGLGDILQFVRYVPLLVERGADVTLLVKPVLHRLLRPVAQVARLVAEPLEDDFDFQSALLSLPQGFGTILTTIPAAIPYLTAEPERVAHWRDKIGADGFKIGIVWQGNPQGAVDAGRSYPVRYLEPIARLANIRLISLQKNHGLDQISSLPAGMTIETLGPDFDDGQDAFIDTAAVMASLDLVITSDTSVAHLAGALGRPTWIALKHVPDWRWLREGPDSPWYPSLRLYRQRTAGDWSSVFAAMAADLGTTSGVEP